MRFFIIGSLIISAIVVRLCRNDNSAKSHTVNAG